ncbi:hypothetical protein DNTS_021881 [Danionella cerebrum]|uniref:Enoyl reductase (ER) domain-containing protein n=1 Tax=Danionella cerebrum TaxID=2873325 RepID=A0A553R5G0_9TELE|nr:hypothetical protein DNTS_021881 [Danionella translucida]
MGTEDKVIKCKAAVAWEPGKPLSIEEVEVAPPKSHEVRIKIVASGVCHSDWAYLYDFSKMKPRPFPLVLGHEGAGVVESVGPNVTKVSKGDNVIPLFLPQCGECERCQSPKTNLCSKNWQKTQQCVLADGTSRITCKKQQVYQFIGISTFSEYTVVPEDNVTKIHPDAPLDRVCLLGCGVSTGYGAAINTGKVEPGSTCVVFGLGAVGLAAVMGCKVAGASRIIAVDINPEKSEIAKIFGATEFVNPKEHSKPIQEVLRELTNGGVDFSLECVGNVGVMRAALEASCPAGGVCVIVGWIETEELSLAPIDILLGRTLKGTYFGGWKSVDAVPRLVQDYLSGRLLLDEFVTHRLTLDQINQAFDLLISGKRTMDTEGKVIKCKAAVAWEPGKPLSIEEVEVAPPKAHEVRIKIVASGVCHTDWTFLHEVGQNMNPPPFPVVLGHEGAGVVESVGPGVTKIAKGDKVIPLVVPQCGECERCLSPKTNLCTKNWEQNQKCLLADGTTRITCKNQQVHQFIGISTFSEYTVAPEECVTKIHPDAPLDRVCLLGCGVSTGYGAAINTGKVEPGSTCAVFGLGAVGLAAVMGCKVAGASRIIAVDINPEKSEIAKIFGATEFVNPKEHSKPIQEVLRELTNGGVDFSLECVGNVGVMVSWKSVEAVPKLVQDYLSKKILLDEFVTHNLTLDQINHAFDLMITGKSIRSIIRM